MTDIQPVVPAAIAGEVEQNPATYLTYGTDLGFVLDVIDFTDPIDIETETASDTDWAIHGALNYVRAQITRRRAVQAGPRTGVDYCGVDDRYGRACGPDLGLPSCAWHGRIAAPAADATTVKELS